MMESETVTETNEGMNIKPEYVVDVKPNGESQPETAGILSIKPEYVIKVEGNGESPSKKPKLDGEPKSKPRGQFKNRYNKNKLHFDQSLKLCNVLVDVPEGEETLPECQHPKCKHLHSIEKYLENRPPDIGEECYVFKTRGHCPRGVTCRFGRSHVTENGRNKRIEGVENKNTTRNFMLKEVQAKLRKKTYDFSKSSEILKKLPNYRDNSNLEDVEKAVGFSQDLIKEEKKTINWKGKLYLSPLTTLGNMPFRRICKEFGADVTCSEMAMSSSILQSFQYEWALLKRHETEDLFGVQLCGNNPYMMTKCAQLLEETTDIDFIDINLGCPIDLVYQKGGGSGLLRREKVLESVVNSMSQVMNLPLTIKTRTGVYMDKNIAHKLMPVFTSAGVSLITVHGRSREQRYTKTPDWGYIDECAKIASPTPVFGNGDVLSYEDYNHAISTYPNISGVMIGRGALYKPWLFKEIKEQKDWDISSSERLEILKKFINYGLDHWGSDTKGVELTRKFALEWLSFLCRYVPIGLLENPPQKINQRPPRFIGRDDMETLMASQNCSDWIKITEMFLGPVPDNFHFLPKHKANSWVG